MGLPPLEYSDCFLDSPSFREIIALYEQELEANAKVVKNLVRECNNMIQKTEEYSRVQQEFARSLSQFRFQTIGTEQTEDEVQIADSLQSFARLFLSIEDYRQNMLMAIKVRLLKTLENFRKEHMKKAIEDKKKFDEASRKYYNFLHGYLSIKTKKRDASNLGGATEKRDFFEIEKAAFRQVSFDYVCRLQDVHAQKHYELVEPFLGYVSDVTTFLHQAYEDAVSLKHQIEGIQVKVQLLRKTNEQEQEKAYELKAKVIEDGLQGLVHHPEFLKQGHMFLMERRRGITGIHWQRYFCQFQKVENNKLIKFIALSAQQKASVPLDEWMEVKDCVRSKGDEVDRRFCFDLSCNYKSNQLTTTVQALSDDDRWAWIQVMEGREPVYYSLRALDVTKITPSGYRFVEKCLDILEDRGLEEEGIYGRPGTLAKSNQLIKDAIVNNMVKSLDLQDEIEWDTKTIASAVKGYFSKQLGEPVTTFQLYPRFIAAAKYNDGDKRIEAVKELIDELPDVNRNILVVLMAHLRNVASKSSKNKMKASNLGVCFGPILIRPEHETVASIVDIRYQNIIVESMIQHFDRIFPDSTRLRPFPRPVDNTSSATEVPRTSNSQLATAKRRAPPVAPTKRMSAAEYIKKTHENRAQTFSASEPSDKDIPPLDVSQRPTTPPSKNIQPLAGVGRQTTILDIDKDFTQVFDSVKSVADEWKTIGIYLGITYDKLRAIDKNEDRVEDKLMELLAVWLKSETKDQPKASWRKLSEAVSEVDRILAEKIAKEHHCGCNKKTVCEFKSGDPEEATCNEGVSASDTDIISTDPSKCYSATENTEASASIEQTVLSSCDNNQQFMSEMKDKIMKNLFQEVEFLQARLAEKDEVKTSLNAEVQFDYWVPMEDLLHGATVVDEIVFNTHGDKEQEYPWTECGFSLLVPEGALSKTETCPVAVKALISGRFQFPKRFQLISALYAISPGRKFTKKVKITLQHCFLIERFEQLKRLCIVKAEPTEPGNPYIFQIIKGGCFKPGSQYCEVWLSDFSLAGAGVLSDNSDDNEDSSSQSDAGTEGSCNEEGSSGSESDEDQTLPHHGQEEHGTRYHSEHPATSVSLRGPGIQSVPVVEDTTAEGEERFSKQRQSSIGRDPMVCTGDILSCDKDTADTSVNAVSSSDHATVLIQKKPHPPETERLPLEENEKFQVTKEDEQLYRAYFFLRTMSRNKWEFILVALKHLYVHIKYITNNFKEVEVTSFEFRFILNVPEGPAITFLFTEKENKSLSSGWFVKPLVLPCCITKKAIEALCTQELRIQEECVYCDIPKCKAVVFAEEGAASYMEYNVQVKGVQKEKTVKIVRWFDGGNDGSQLQAQQNHGAVNTDQDPNSQSIDIKAVISCIKEVVDKRFADLKGICESSIETVTAEMFAAGLISESVKSYDAMMKEFHAGFVFMEELSEVEEHCKTFFGVFHKLGGPFLRAGNSIKKCALQKIKSTHNLSLSFD